MKKIFGFFAIFMLVFSTIAIAEEDTQTFWNVGDAIKGVKLIAVDLNDNSCTVEYKEATYTIDKESTKTMPDGLFVKVLRVMHSNRRATSDYCELRIGNNLDDDSTPRIEQKETDDGENSTRERAREEYNLIRKEPVKELRQEKIERTKAYKNAKDSYKDKKEDLLQSRTKYRDCLSSDTEECKSTVKKTKLNAKEHLINSANLIIENLEKLKLNIQSSEDLTQDEVDELTKKIDEQIKKIQDAKSTLDNIDENTSRDEIKEAASAIRQSWQEVKVHYHKAKLRHLGARLRNLIVKAEIIGERAGEKASRLESEELNLLINEYNLNVEKAKEQYELGKKVWEKIVVPGQVDESTREAQKYLKEANNNLKEAREKLREIMKMFKEKRIQFSLDSKEVEV